MLKAVKWFVAGVVAELFGTAKAGRKRYAVKHARPRLEGMEDRTVPSGFNYWQANVSNSWNVDDNWSLGHVPTPTEVAVLDDLFTTANCDYSGSGGAIANTVMLMPDYTGTLTINASGAVQLYGLEQNDGHVVFAAASADLEVDNWTFTGGAVNANTATAAQVKAMKEINWVAAKELEVGANVELAAGGVGTIDMSNNKTVSLRNNANITNNGMFTFKQGRVSGEHQSNTTNVFDNKGTLKKTTNGEADFPYVTVKNTTASSLLSVEIGTLWIKNSGASTAAFVQTGGTTQVYASAKLTGVPENFTDFAIEIRAGNFYTMGTGQATVEGNTLFKDCVVQLSRDDLTLCGRLKVTGKVQFEGTAEYICKLKGDGSDSDRITVTDDIILRPPGLGNHTKLTLWVLGTLQSQKTWTILQSTSGSFQRDFFTKNLNGYSLATEIIAAEKRYQVES